VLEQAGFALLLAGARHVKILPGRKTDVCDAAWLARAVGARAAAGQLCAPGPNPPAARPRPATASGRVQAHSSEGQRIHKTLEDAGIKLDSVAARGAGRLGSGDAGGPGRRPSATPRCLPSWPGGGPGAKLPQLRQALRAGPVRSHHALPVRLALAHLEQLEASIAELDAQVDRVLVPFAQARDPLDTITGVGKRAPRVHDRARSGWTCRCSPPPRTWRGGRAAVRATTPTGGKRRSGTTTKGNRWLGEVLTRVRVGGDAQPRHVPVGPVLAAGLPHRQEEGSHRRGATLFW
jgi:transposase